MTLLILLLAPSIAYAGSPNGGVAGGIFLRSGENPYPSTPTFVGRVGYDFTERWAGEFNFGVGFGDQEMNSGTYPFTYFTPRVDGIYTIMPGKRFTPFLRFGLGMQMIQSHRPDSPDTPYDDSVTLSRGESLPEAGVGARFNLVGPLGLRTDLMFVPQLGDHDVGTQTDIYPNLEWTIGLDLRAPPNPDKDDDGIKDKADKCPLDPEDKDGFEDEDGCAEVDNDKDGLTDDIDKCALEPEDIDSFQDEDGCPDPDNDGDAIADAADKCPTDAEDKDSFQDEDGCPDPDNDGDNIADKRDKCPLEPETFNKYQDRDGCPDEVPAAVAKFTGKIEGITFETNKAVIKKTSEPTLRDAMKVLHDFPEVRLEVQGHTDDVGDDAKNMTLSQARADAVVKWFVDHGVAADRLVAKGYGETTPMVPNNSKANQAQNRRVEFQLIQDKD